MKSFIVDNDVMLPLMASKGWDAEKNELIINPKIYDSKNKKWVSKKSKSINAMPSIQQTIRSFRDIYSVTENKKTGFVSISIDFLPARLKVSIKLSAIFFKFIFLYFN